ncbi:MAG: hypothetical protein ACO388_08605, partial [Saprospiraceae bacterium]
MVLIYWANFTILYGQSPHGVNFSIDCASCHNTSNWEVEPGNITFDHNTTLFSLEGRHNELSCVSCHSDLVFSNANSECISCHLDIHRNTLGGDCTRCHDATNWLVDNIPQIHQENGFELLGNHGSASCIDCHFQIDELVFSRIGNECMTCHMEDYAGTILPNHELSGLGTNCVDCHSMEEQEWSASFFDHGFFPLEEGHKIENCVSCHTNSDYSSTPSDCISCHETDYNIAENPSHTAFNLSTDCVECHTLSPDWQPALFSVHDDYFPIYSGGHGGAWDACVDCHTIEGNFQTFECINCHVQGETAEQHEQVVGYYYSDTYCKTCHPTGEADQLFDHNSTAFPLEGVHLQTDCRACHEVGFTGTSTVCVDCHQMDYTSSVDPNHTSLNLSLDCATCHTAEPDWQPALFPVHDEFYELRGAHKAIENECLQCHDQGYSSTPNTCVGCHEGVYQTAVNPSHTSAQFSLECSSCHNEETWNETTYGHEFYPLTGAHEEVSEGCISCHTNEVYQGTPNTCVDCHQMDYEGAKSPDHVQFDIPTDCASCHSTEPGWQPATFDIHDRFYVLEGAHRVIQNECASCHNETFTNTPTDCIGCHSEDYQAAIAPNHVVLLFPTTCVDCHGQDQWIPSTFNHDEIYVLEGAHQIIENECLLCHDQGYSNTPNTCVGCHEGVYQTAVNPIHSSAGFETECVECHGQNTWNETTYGHEFYPLTGAHEQVSEGCISCHTNEVYQGTSNTCVDCHQMDYEGAKSPDHVQFDIPIDCASCHSTEPGWQPARFDIHDQFYVLEGAHRVVQNECASCHNETFTNTPTECIGCHQQDYIATNEPDHELFECSTNCVDCHTQDKWEPSTFNHDEFYELRGAHANIKNECNSCHVGGYSNTPTTCVGCHSQDFDNSRNPNHSQAGFSTNCASCHNENAWEPSSFNHNQYYALTGGHDIVKNDCNSCHANGYSNTPTDCYSCHQSDYVTTRNPDHEVLGFPTNCASCHTTNPGWSPATFDHDQFYVLRGAHAGISNECAQCHNSTFTNTPTTCFGCH